jgi:hypothetical protein
LTDRKHCSTYWHMQDSLDHATIVYYTEQLISLTKYVSKGAYSEIRSSSDIHSIGNCVVIVMDLVDMRSNYIGQGCSTNAQTIPPCICIATRS